MLALSARSGFEAENRAAGDHGPRHLALYGPAVVRRVLALRAQRGDVDAPWPVEVENRQIGGRARFQAAARQAEDFRRPLRDRAHHLEQAETAVVVELERQRQQRLETDDAGFGRREWQAFRFL